eukprot:1968773-Amphidinium_carterae.1
MASPIRAMEKAIMAMRDIGRGDFNPDTTRSGRWKCEPPAEVVESDSSSTDESEDSTSSSDADHQNDGTEYTEVDG